MNKNFKQIEHRLNNFKSIDIKIRNIDLDINFLKNDISISGTSFEERPSSTNAFSSVVENNAVRREEKNVLDNLERLERQKQLLLKEKSKMENALSALSDMEYEVIALRYFSRNKATWTGVSTRLGYAEVWCKKVRAEAINKLIHLLS